MTLVSTAPGGHARADARPSIEAASGALSRAVDFFRTKVAIRGSYVWIYAADLSERRGEGRTTLTQGWVQPPGTPAVGAAYLAAYERTGKRYLLDAAVQSAHALTATQLESGGWWPLMEFDPTARKAWCYRVERHCRSTPAARENENSNATSIDDDTSQSALRFLMRVDRKLQGRDTRIHDAVVYGLQKFMDAQYPNGAWPNRFDRAVAHELVVRRARARFPDRWPKVYQKITDPVVYIVNDNAIADVVSVFLLAHRLYGRRDYLAAATRGGDFLLAAQMPAPQGGWAQTYNRSMEPIWGRKFEPPAIAARETGGALKVLLDLYVRTGEERFLKGAGVAAAWLKSARRSDGRWTRFYELRSNRPLFVNADYKLTNEPRNVPRHYSFVGTYGIPSTLTYYEAIARQKRQGGNADLSGRRVAASEPDSVACLAPSASSIIGRLDKAGRWVEDGRILSETFIANISLLSRYLAAARLGRAKSASC